LLLAVVDLALLNACLLVAATLWNGFPFSLPAVVSTAKWHVTLWLVWTGLSMVLDLYNLARAASATSILPGAAVGALLTALVYLAIPWLAPPIQTRTFVFAFALLAMATVAGWRVVYALLISQPAFYRRVIVLGAGPLARDLARELNRATLAGKANPFQGTGNQVVGLVPSVPSDTRGRSSTSGY